MLFPERVAPVVAATAALSVSAEMVRNWTPEPVVNDSAFMDAATFVAERQPRAMLPEVSAPPNLEDANRDWLRARLSGGAIYVRSNSRHQAGIADMIRLMDSGMSYR